MPEKYDEYLETLPYLEATDLNPLFEEIFGKWEVRESVQSLPEDDAEKMRKWRAKK